MNIKRKQFQLSMAFILMALMSCFYWSCKQDSSPLSHSDTSPGTPIPFDSIQKDQIDTIVAHINAQIRAAGPPSKLPYPKYVVEDTLFYWVVDSNSARISIEFNAAQEIIWPTFYLYKGELVFIRFRYHSSGFPQPFASESFIYLNNHKIVYCLERSTKLDPGMPPSSLKQKKHTKSTRTYEEVEKDYKPLWNSTVDYMMEHHCFPPGFQR